MMTMTVRTWSRRLAFALAAAWAVPTALGAQAVAAPPTPGAGGVAAYVPDVARGQAFELSIRNIMRGEEHVGAAPREIRWTDDGRWVYFSWKPGGRPWDAPRETYRVSASGGEPEVVSEDALRETQPFLVSGDLTRDRRRKVVSVEGDLYLVDRRRMTARRLTRTEEAERAPLFTPDERAVLFQKGNDLYRLHLESGELVQLTRIESGSPPSEEPEPTGQRAFLEEQQLELFEHVRREAAREARRDSLREAREAEGPRRVYMGNGWRAQGLTPTRDGAYALIRSFRPAQGAKRTVVPDWITRDGYTRDLTVRTKVGDAQGESRLGLITTATGEVRWLDLVPEGYEGEGAPRVFNAGWNDAGTTAFVFAVSFDDKDRWLWAVDAATGARTLLDHLHDDAWVAGPCFARCVGFIPGSDLVYFVSEETGYAHLYTVQADGTGKRALTAGSWEVLDVRIPEDRSHFLLRTNEGSPFDEHVYRMDFDGRDRRALTRGEGRFVATPSPDGKRLAVVHDVANRPPELYLADSDGSDMEQVTESPTAEWSSFPWIKPEIVHFQAEDGTMVPARIYRPSDVGAEPNGAGVIFVHGAGYLHNVHNYWSSYYREYQFNHFLAANGYTVLDIDYRGSAGYGAEWRTAIYRWMGGKDLSDQVDGAKYLVAREGVDPKRIGLYGGSYGGFITLMGLFTAGETFKAGAALRSVTDWAHYNHGYTSRILNLPQEDEEAYRRSSPIYFAENFRPDQHLVMLHGMVDTNVHFSDVVRLAQRLIELGKENWELAVYPVENHGFVEPSSWTDEYRRIFELFERTLREPGCTDGGGFCTVRGDVN